MSTRSAPREQQRRTIPVSGMTCDACERRVGRALLRIPGVESVEVSARKGTAVVTGERPPSRDELEAAIRSAGYEPAAPAWVTTEAATWLTVALSGLAVVALAWLAFFTNLTQKWSQRGDTFARGLALGGIAALSAGVFHALMEFPFHIPAISLGFAAIAALTYNATHYHHQGMEFFSYRTLKLPGNHRTPAALLLVALIGLQIAFGLRVCYNWSAEWSASTEFNSTRTAPKLAVADFRQALRYNPINSKYYLGLAETLAEGTSPGEAGSDAEKSLKSAIFYAPANWGYRLKMADFYLGRYLDAPEHHIPSALKELAAAVYLFPESGLIHFRLASVLAWTEKYYPRLIPTALRGGQSSHFSEAIRLDPSLKKYLPVGLITSH